MESSPALFYLALLVATLIGTLLGWLYARTRLGRDHVPRETVTADYVGRDLYEQVRGDAEMQYENLQEHVRTIGDLRGELAGLQADYRNLKQRLEQQAAEFSRLQEASVAHFERAADRLLEEKSKRFTQQNAQQLDGLLRPLKERIQGFEQQVERRFLKETEDRVTLRTEIQHLQRLNQQISLEANNLAGALRGNTKTQGDWGEWQLLTLLEASGLHEGVHFDVQASFADENGRQKRPDFIIRLPEDKHLVIDSKVSLNAYERYCSCGEDDKAQRNLEMNAHLRSLRQHIADLASKNYTALHQINSPDYLLLFVPIEPALNLALSHDKQLFLEALNRNIVLVTPATLLATLRTVSYIWKQDNQKKNVLEIARQSGLLYDQFVGFTHELQHIGKRLDQAQHAYQSAMTKLHTGARPGATLIGRAEKLRILGARTKKRLDSQLLEEE